MVLSPLSVAFIPSLLCLAVRKPVPMTCDGVQAPGAFQNRGQKPDSVFLSRQTTRCILQSTALFAARRRGGAAPSARRNGKIGELEVESSLVARGFFPIIGSDDSGRGAIAGPVVTASCCIIAPLDDYVPIEGVQDSKMLTPEMRKDVYETIVSQPEIYAYRIATRSHLEIDEMNIQKATMAAFAESIDLLVTEELPKHARKAQENKGEPDIDVNSFSPYSIVDGKQSPKLELTKTPCRPWVKGDAHVYTIALASILAKVTHDSFMIGEAHKNYPEYGFDVNKGHALPDHVIAIHTHGPSPIHRKSVRTMRGR